MKTHVSIVVSIALLSSVGRPHAAADEASTPPWSARSQGGMVASDSPEASQIGADVLAAGGNAFDAAVAVSFALNVGRPYSTGLGGGGFMLAYVAKENRYVCLDFREMAPAGATPDYFTRMRERRGDGPAPSLYGGPAVGVPGQLAGLAEINRRFGSKSLSELIRPALALCRVGAAVDANFRDACQSTIALYKRHTQLRALAPHINRIFLSDELTAPDIGMRLPRPDLARALELIAKQGADAFYAGEIGAAVVAAANAYDGVLTSADLANYRVKERTPVRGVFGAFEVISMPPPSSGGVALLQALQILEAARGGEKRAFTPAEHMHLRVESLKHAFADRARWLADSDFVDVPLDLLTSREYAAQLAKRVDPQRAGASDGYGVEQLPEDRGTSHYCVVDRDGNVVALTETINATFGSLVVAHPYGIVLNNEMDDFVTESGAANLYGLQQSDRNLVEPGKRPLSSMSPTIVTRDNLPVLALGGSGGPRIISSVFHVLLNVIDIRLPLATAVESVRAHHQWRPDVIYFDRPAPEGAAALRGFGHEISNEHRYGVVQAIRIERDSDTAISALQGVSDPRKGGRPVGVER